MLGDAVRRVLEDYPRIFYACHTRHVRDPATRKLVSAHQASILDHLDERDPTSLTLLARHMGVTAGTMSVAVDRLVRAGYVRRARDPTDGRRVQLRLTSAGARVRDAHSVLEPERVRAMLARLNPRERTDALHGLRLLAEAAMREMPKKRLYGLGRRDAVRRPVT
jgi:DNA-binding MarR family transcriptional regulator